MTKQTFVFNDGTRATKEVHRQVSKKFDAFTVQISRVFWYFIGRVPQWRYIYEEIDNTEDSVIYAHYVSEENVRKSYPWFFEGEREEVSA